MTRSRTTRAEEARTTEVREVLSALATSPLHVPEHEIPEDKEYGWIRISTLGEEDEGNRVEKARLGWSVVPAARHPTIGNNVDIFGAREVSEQKNFIEFRGLVLCERPKVLGDAIRRAMAKEHDEIMRSTPGMEDLATGYVKANRQEWTGDGFAS